MMSMTNSKSCENRSTSLEETLRLQQEVIEELESRLLTQQDEFLNLLNGSKSQIEELQRQLNELLSFPDAPLRLENIKLRKECDELRKENFRLLVLERYFEILVLKAPYDY